MLRSELRSYLSLGLVAGLSGEAAGVAGHAATPATGGRGGGALLRAANALPAEVADNGHLLARLPGNNNNKRGS